jgi:hypothetical protein
MNDRRLEVINGVYELVCESPGLTKSIPAVIRLPEPKFFGSPVVPILRRANALDAAPSSFLSHYAQRDPEEFRRCFE